MKIRFFTLLLLLSLTSKVVWAKRELQENSGEGSEELIDIDTIRSGSYSNEELEQICLSFGGFYKFPSCFEFDGLTSKDVVV